MSEPNTPAQAQLSFDTVLEQLQVLVDRLEQGNLSLEDALTAYEQGVGLARRGHSVLDQAEKRIELLLRRDNQDVVVALDDDDQHGEGR